MLLQDSKLYRNPFMCAQTAYYKGQPVLCPDCWKVTFTQPGEHASCHYCARILRYVTPEDPKQEEKAPLRD